MYAYTSEYSSSSSLDTWKCLQGLPDSNDMSHFVNDDGSKSTIFLEVIDVVDVKGHVSRRADRHAFTPNRSWTGKAKSSSGPVNRFDGCRDQKLPSRACRRPSARHVSNDFLPPAPHRSFAKKRERHEKKFEHTVGCGSDVFKVGSVYYISYKKVPAAGCYRFRGA